MVYIDVYIIRNMAADAALLWLAGLFCRKRARWYRFLAGGACGTAWAVAVLLLAPLQSAAVRGIGTILMGGVMCAVTFGTDSDRGLLRVCAAFFVTAWMAGGIARWVYELTGAGYYLQMILYGTGEAPKEFYIAAVSAAAFILLAAAAVLWRRYRSRECFYAEVEIRAGEKTAAATALIDTGNRLRSPSGQPVAVAARPLFTELFGEEEVMFAEQYQAAQTQNKWIYIPYRSIGKKDGLLPAVRTTSITIHKEEGAVTVPEAWLALGPELLCSDGKRQVILPPEW